MQFDISCIYQKLLVFAIWALQRRVVNASNNNYDANIYSMSMQRDWLYESTAITMKYEGCVWGYVDADDREDMACMESESGDGTTYWYMMANCRRAQVAFSLYDGTSTKKNKWKESFVTKRGVAEFAYTLGEYGYNSPVCGGDVCSFPMCEEDGNGYYMAVGCSSTGTFTIDRFTDQYCTQYADNYDTLDNFNYQMKSLASGYQVFNYKTDEDVSYSMASLLISSSSTCTENESSLCKTTSFVANSGSGSLGQRTTNRFTSGSQSFTNKLKYGLGSFMLLGSVVMFFGILFTNRKKRRAMMHRKFKSSSSKKRSSRSRSSKKRSSSSKKSSGIFA